MLLTHMGRSYGSDTDIIPTDERLTAAGNVPWWVLLRQGRYKYIRTLVEGIRADEATWSDVRLAGGPKGIVASRDAIDGTTGSWVYDLWLCERIAERLELAPLKAARVGPRWRVPYGFGKKLEPDDERA